MPKSSIATPTPSSRSCQSLRIESSMSCINVLSVISMSSPVAPGVNPLLREARFPRNRGGAIAAAIR